MRSLLKYVLASYFCIASLECIAQVNSEKFISVADIHFNPFFLCEAGKKSCPLLDKLSEGNAEKWPEIFELNGGNAKAKPYQDTNYNLLKAVIGQMKHVAQKEHPAFIIILGDFLAHDFRSEYMKYSKQKSQKSYELFVKKTFQFLADEFANNFPDLDTYFVVGNNDSYYGDYSTTPNGKFFHDMSEIWSRLIKDKNNKENFMKTFSQVGFYEISYPNESNQKILVLNTVIFSIHSLGKNVNAAAIEQMKWLNQELTAAKNQHQRIILAYHIPVGVDVYATIQNKFNKIIDFWQKKYSFRFEKELISYPIVSAILSGHVHIDTLQTITLKSIADVPVNITPSVSPVFGNDPGFKLITLDAKTFNIEDSDTYYYPLGHMSKLRKGYMQYDKLITRA